MQYDLELETMMSGIAADLGDVDGYEAPPVELTTTCPPGSVSDGQGGCIYELPPVEITETPPGTGPYGETPPGFVAPGAVPPRPEKWDLEAQPFALLTVSTGDTLVGLSATYLGDGARWREIWDTGWNRQKFPSPDKLDNPGPLQMPDEARANMVNWLNKGQPPGTLPGKLPPETLIEKGKRSWPLLVAGGLVIAGVAVVATKA